LINLDKGDRFLLTILSILFGLLVGSVALIISNVNPLNAYLTVFKEIIFSFKNLFTVIMLATPIMITGYSVSFAYKTGLFNIGVEGQFIIGSIVAALTGYFLNLPFIIHPIVCIILSAIAGGFYAAISGFLKVKFKVNEVLSSLMLNWIAFHLNNFIIDLPFIKSPNSENSYKILDTAKIAILNKWKLSNEGIEWKINHKGEFLSEILRSDLNIGIFIGLLIGVFYYIILYKTILGYELKAVGYNKYGAEYGGINIAKAIVISMFISGAIAGIAGASNVLGRNFEIVILNSMEQNGFNGIAVAFIGSNNPIGIIFAAIFFAFLNLVGRNMQLDFNIASEIKYIIIGSMLLFNSAIYIIVYFKNKMRERRG